MRVRVIILDRDVLEAKIEEIVDTFIEDELDTAAVAVVVEAEHSCMSIRGVRKHGSATVTSSMRGSFRTDPSSRAELMSLIHG